MRTNTTYSIMWATSSILVAASAVSVFTPAVVSSASESIDDLIFVSQMNVDADGAGCDSVSLYTTAERVPRFRADQPYLKTYAGGFAATTDLSLVLSPGTNWVVPNGYTHHLIALSPNGGDPKSWERREIVGARFAPGNAIAIMPDDETLLVATVGASSTGAATVQRPIVVRKFLLSEISPTGQIGPERGAYPISGGTHSSQMGQILPSQDGRFAHMLVQGRILTIDVGTMTDASPPIDLMERFPNDDRWMYAFQETAAFALDERYLVTRQSDHLSGPNDLDVIDVVDRTAWTLPIQAEKCNSATRSQACGQVAINHGPMNHGLMAIRGSSEVGVYAFEPHGPVRRLSRLPLDVVQIGLLPAPLAWTADGSHLIVGANAIIGVQTGNRAAFLVLEVADQGTRLIPERWLTPCGSTEGDNEPIAIFTNNRRLARVPTLTPVPTPTVTDESRRTPTATKTATALPSSSPTQTTTLIPPPSLTPTPAPTPLPLYLPLALRERCIPDEQRLDVAIVLDASTSMLEPTSAGRTKLVAATEAARVLLDQLRLAKGDQAALIAFNADVVTLQTLTSFRADLDAAMLRIAVAQQTRIDLGIQAAADELLSPRSIPSHTPVLVVLTDGRANPVPADVAVAIAAAAKAAGITIHTIGVGADLDVDALRAMASSPAHMHLAPDAEQLAEIYRAIAVALPCAGGYWPSGDRP